MFRLPVQIHINFHFSEFLTRFIHFISCHKLAMRKKRRLFYVQWQVYRQILDLFAVELQMG